MSTIFGATVGTPVPQSDWNQKNPNTADYIKNKPEVANALKGSASGNPITLDDVSPLEHELKVTVSAEDKQELVVDLEQEYYTHFMPYESLNLILNEIVFDENLGEFILLRFSGNYSCTYGRSDNREETAKTFKIGDTFFFDYNEGFWQKLYRKIKVDTTITVQEGNKEPQTFSADENGNVKGIFGKGEEMTFSAEDGVAISVEYNRDINKSSGSGGGGADGKDGKDGENGATFTPSIVGEGWLSWSNDKGLPNPDDFYIKGDQGEQGIQGEKGDTGATGAKGEKGNNGVSAYHRWNGTVLEITSASGTSSADLKGEAGRTPQKGVDYFTQSDINDIVNQVFERVGNGNGVKY